MAVTLVRQVSPSPNIQNSDDARAFRYAFGRDGIVKNYRNECSVDENIKTAFSIKSGELVLDGWQVKLDSEGVIVSLLSAQGTYYYSIYLEINLAAQTAQIKSTYSTLAYPEINRGDDLTSVTNGTARLNLFKVKVVNGNWETYEQLVNIIDYAGNEIDEINRRLDELGFRQGVIYVDGNPLDDSQELPRAKVTKQGKYAIMNLSVYQFSSDVVTLSVPNEFKPKNDTTLIATYVNSSFGITNVVSLTLTTLGTITITNARSGILFTITNFGYEIA